MEGKLLSFSPKMVNGIQETFNGKNGILYKFIVTMEINGTPEVGESSSNKTTPSWKVGNNFSFERSVAGQQGQFINYKGLKDLTNPFVPGAAGVNKSKGGIDFARQKALECAYHATSSFWCHDPNKDKNYKPNLYNIPAEIFYDNIIKSGDENDIWKGIAALNALVERVDRVEPIMPMEGVKLIDSWLNQWNIIKTNINSKLNGNQNITEPH